MNKNEANSAAVRTSALCGPLIALALAVLGTMLLKSGGRKLAGLGDAGQLSDGSAIETEIQAEPVPDPADLARYRKEVGEVLADYSREIGEAAEGFRRNLERERSGFAAARDAIPSAIRPYGTFGKNKDVVVAVVKDKIKKTNRVEELIRADFMEPVFEPAMMAAGRMESAYDTLLADMEKARKGAGRRLMVSAGKVPGMPNGSALEKRLAKQGEDVAKAAATAFGTVAGANVAVGLAGGFELAFIRTTARSVAKLCSRAAAKGAASATAPAADGPLPIGDVIAVAGFAWTAWDIYQLTHVMPRNLGQGLSESVDSMEAATLQDIKGRAKAAIGAYHAETGAMLKAAEAALESVN